MLSSDTTLVSVFDIAMLPVIKRGSGTVKVIVSDSYYPPVLESTIETLYPDVPAVVIGLLIPLI